ncbi:MAG: hypothetical protein NC311_01655 [Muribaculaceae bacterium]|nr:hypothetical protein [Muribaculaceae bacterium]
MTHLDLHADKQSRMQLGNRLSGFACGFGIKLYQSDLDYACNVMWRDKSARILLHGMEYRGLENNPNYADQYMDMPELINLWCRYIVIAERFYYDPRCPRGIKCVLFAFMGMYRNQLGNIPGGMAVLNMRRKYIERWFEMCR